LDLIHKNAIQTRGLLTTGIDQTSLALSTIHSYVIGSTISWVTAIPASLSIHTLISYLERLVDYPEATQVFDFANGLMHLVSVRVDALSRLANHPISDIHIDSTSQRSRVVTIFRDGEPFIPTGSTVLEVGDEVFFIAPTGDAHKVSRVLHHIDQPVQRVLIIGGGHVGVGLADTLSNRMTPKLIEHNADRVQQLAARLNGKAIVIHGEAIDEAVLESEQVQSMDMVLALTNDDEDNIMSAMLAKRLGARRVVAIVNRRSYADLISEAMVDVAVTPADITLGAVLQYIRRADVSVMHSIRSGRVEAFEIVIRKPKFFGGVLGKRLIDVEMPPQTSLAAIVRQGRPGGPPEVLFASNELRLMEGDHAIVFVLDRSAVRKIERMFGMVTRGLGL
jgi:trk system potassium uptake protein